MTPEKSLLPLSLTSCLCWSLFHSLLCTGSLGFSPALLFVSFRNEIYVLHRNGLNSRPISLASVQCRERTRRILYTRDDSVSTCNLGPIDFLYVQVLLSLRGSSGFVDAGVGKMVSSQLPTPYFASPTPYSLFLPPALSLTSLIVYFAASFIIAPSLSLSSSPRRCPFIKMFFYCFSHILLSLIFSLYLLPTLIPFVKHTDNNLLLSAYLEHACESQVKKN